MVVNGGLWLDDPDVDAITRLCNDISAVRYREREREREIGCVCERERVCVCVREREKVCVCVGERERVSERERECVCVIQPALLVPSSILVLSQLG